jgi:hypothetical protein
VSASDASQTSGGFTRATQWGATLAPRRRSGALVLAVIALVVLIGAGVWSRLTVRASLDRLVSEDLNAILDADVAGLEAWRASLLELVEAWAGAHRLRAQVAELLALSIESSADGERLRSAPALASLREVLAPAVGASDSRGFGIVDRTGTVVAASADAVIGEIMSPEGMAAVAPAFRGEVGLNPPLARGAVLPGLGEGAQGAMPLDSEELLMMAVAPVRDDAGRVVAALVFRIDPEEDFNRILSVARMGESGETYAFDAGGLLLSHSRFEEQMDESGAFEAADGSTLPLTVRDPGGDLTKGFRPAGPPASWPLTRAAASALAGDDGTELTAYRDYRGVEVIGAWRWLEGFGMGVVTEIDRAEIDRILAPLNISVWGLLGLVAAAAGGAVFLRWRVSRLQIQVDEAEQLGQYTLEEKLGEGGMGAVYRARHSMLHRPTAVKLLRPDAMSDEAIARFEQEVQLTAQLTHPNTIEVYDYGRTPKGIFYYAMEYLDGLDLSALVRRDGAQPPARVVYLLQQVLQSLAEAHSVGLIHRDIKPLNIMVCERGGLADVVKVLDFGLVKDVSEGGVEMTAADMILGTPAYLSPERLREPDKADARSDLWAVGAVGYYLLTGVEAFGGAGAAEIAGKVLSTEPKPVLELVPDTPVLLVELIARCLDKEPSSRPASAAEALQLLQEATAAGLAPWTQAQARSWWQTYGRHARAQAPPSPPAGGDDETLYMESES